MGFTSTKVLIHADGRSGTFTGGHDRLQHIASRVARDPQAWNRCLLMTADVDAATLVDRCTEVRRERRVAFAAEMIEEHAAPHRLAFREDESNAIAVALDGAELAMLDTNPALCEARAHRVADLRATFGAKHDVLAPLPEQEREPRAGFVG
jgi:hypothetical protein